MSAKPESQTVHVPCRPQDVAAFLDEAERLVSESGQKLTPIRRKVLELLAARDEPAKAYDLMTHLDGEGAPQPPTVYRALDFLRDAGLVHKIESLNAYVACGHVQHSHSALFLICENCGGAEELHTERASRAILEETRAAGFQLERAVIEARGLCRNCSA